MKRKITLCLISPLFLLCSIPTSTKADTIFDTCHKTPYTIQTVITDASPSINLAPTLSRTSHNITKTKTTYMRDSSVIVLQSVSITATFTYDGTTSRCISCSPNLALLLLQLGQLNLCHLPKAETLLLHMQQQHILLQVHQKILRKALLFHVVKMVPFHNLFKSFFDII